MVLDDKFAEGLRRPIVQSASTANQSQSVLQNGVPGAAKRKMKWSARSTRTACQRKNIEAISKK